MKVKELSLLIVNEDKGMRQQLASLVSDRYRSVTAAAPEQVISLMTSKSFDPASSCATNPFERILLEVTIERAEMSVNQVKRIIERYAMFLRARKYP